MNFHLELRKSSCRRLRKNWTGSRLRILDVRAHVLTATRVPGWEECQIRYYPAVGRMSIRGPTGQYIGWSDSLADALDQLAGQHIGWADTLADALYELSIAATSQVLPGNGLSNRKEPMQ